MSKKDLLDKIVALEAENLELRRRASELPPMPHNNDGLPFSAPRLIMARWRRGIGLDEMAEMLHLDRETYIGIESEIVAPTMEQIGNMSMLLHFPVKFFFAEGERLINPYTASWSGPRFEWDADHLHVRKWME